MNKIRIAVVSETTVGGVRKQILNLARFIDHDRFELTVILPAWPREGHESETGLADDVGSAGARVVFAPMVRSLSPIQDLRALRCLKKLLKKDTFDVVHVRAAKAGFLGRLACKLNSLSPCFYSPHVFPFQRSGPVSSRVYLALEKMAAGWTTALIVNSEGERDCALLHHLAPAEKIHVVRNAAPIPSRMSSEERSEFRESLGAKPGDTVFLTVARLTGYKGVETLIRACAVVLNHKKTIQLWIAGVGEQAQTLQQLTQDLGLADSVKFLGFRRDVPGLLDACDCFVLASRTEGSPNTILEALAAEKPIIATGVAGTIELLQRSDHCRLLPWNDVPATAAAMEDFVDHPFTGAPLDTLPPEWFDTAKQVKKLEEIYLQYRS